MQEGLVEAYKQVAKIPELKEGRILYCPDNKNNSIISIKILWQWRDLVDLKFQSAENTIQVQVDDGVVVTTPSVPLSHQVILRSVSPSGKKVALISQENDQQKLTICLDNGDVSSFDLSESDKYGKIYSDPYISSLDWSSDEKKVAFIAEEARPSPSNNLFSSSGSQMKEKETRDKFLYLEDWGEQMNGQHQGVVVIFDTEEETSRVRALPEGVTPGQLVWKPNSEIVVGVGYPSKPYRIGIAYCSDRESFLFSVDQNGVYEELTPRGQHVKNPRFGPSGENLVYFQSTIYGERAPAAQLALIKWSSRQSEILVDYVKVSKLIHNEKSFVGVCGKSILPRRCFDVSEERIFFSAYKISNYVTYIINTETKEIFELTDPNEYSSVQDVYKDWILLLKSSLTEPDRIYLCKFSSVGNSLEKYLPITTERSLKNVEKDWVSVLEFQSPIKDKFGQELTVTALYLGPKAGMEKRPLICWPHGGPHSVIGNRFTHAIAFFLNIGYSILLPNYRGSIGHGNDFLTASLGQCGDADVQDCFQSIEEVLKRFKDTVSEDELFIMGFSHGGLLTLHLATNYPNMFKAQATMNPASDIYIMAVVSDIPEWAFLEYGLPFKLGRSLDLESVTRMFERSPIRSVDQMKTPTLFLLGKNDVRVPPSQVLHYHRMLLARGIPSKVYMYEDDHPLRKLISESDYVIQIAKWFAEHNQKDNKTNEK
ncbi:UNVERIFIED_CONTAM: hypothetical protein RMT77_000509 [Armadillidium vulgare]